MRHRYLPQLRYIQQAGHPIDGPPRGLATPLMVAAHWVEYSTDWSRRRQIEESPPAMSIARNESSHSGHRRFARRGSYSSKSIWPSKASQSIHSSQPSLPTHTSNTCQAIQTNLYSQSNYSSLSSPSSHTRRPSRNILSGDIVRLAILVSLGNLVILVIQASLPIQGA